MLVAVEEGLTQVRQALEAAGFRVVGMGPEEIRRARAVVVSGSDENFLQDETRVTGTPVISARGLTAEEVVAAVRERL